MPTAAFVTPELSPLHIIMYSYLSCPNKLSQLPKHLSSPCCHAASLSLRSIPVAASSAPKPPPFFLLRVRPSSQRALYCAPSHHEPRRPRGITSVSQSNKTPRTTHHHGLFNSPGVQYQWCVHSAKCPSSLGIKKIAFIRPPSPGMLLRDPPFRLAIPPWWKTQCACHASTPASPPAIQPVQPVQQQSSPSQPALKARRTTYRLTLCTPRYVVRPPSSTPSLQHRHRRRQKIHGPPPKEISPRRAAHLAETTTDLCTPTPETHTHTHTPSAPMNQTASLFSPPGGERPKIKIKKWPKCPRPWYPRPPSAPGAKLAVSSPLPPPSLLRPAGTHGQVGAL